MSFSLFLLFKVVPLSQRSGLVEWCEQTTPLGNYLIGTQGKDLGAHGKYHPKDWSPMECRKHMQVNVNNNRLLKQNVRRVLSSGIITGELPY